MKICLKSIFETAMANDLCAKNPTRIIKIFFGLVSEKKRTYLEDEVKYILELTDTMP
jgi:hypothetical protein